MNDPRLDLNAIAATSPPVPLTVAVGAAPLVAFRYKPSPTGRVMYGALQPFQTSTLLKCMSWMITSVPVRVSPTPEHVPEHVVEVTVPAVSKDAVDPAGGRNS